MTPDRITELAKQAMVDTCDHFGEETPTQDRLDELHDDAETLWLLQRFAELVRAEALEEAARMCEEMDQNYEEAGLQTSGNAALECAEAIRGLKE